MDSFILEYSMRCNKKKLIMNLDAFTDFRVSLGYRMGISIKAFLLGVQHFGASLVAKFGDRTLVS